MPARRSRPLRVACTLRPLRRLRVMHPLRALAMRGALALLLLAAWHGAVRAQVAAPRSAKASSQTSPFDHLGHARALAQSDSPPAPLICGRCHAMSKSGEPRPPDHAACYGKCHGAAPTKKEAAQAFASLVVAPSSSATVAPSQPAAASAASAAPSAPLPAPELSPRARTCLGCHAAEDLRARRFAMAPPPPSARITVDAAFSHQRHQRYGAPLPAAAGNAKPTAAGAACLTCHRALVEPAPAPLPPSISAPLSAAPSPSTAPAATAPSPPAAPTPTAAPMPTAATSPTTASLSTLPTAATCAASACHDGVAAFSVTERCTQCHREAPTAFYAVPRPTRRFIHRQHQAAIAATGCTSCHRLAKSGGAAGLAKSVEGAGHAACASCHAEDFGAAQPVTCGACHSSTEPWRTLRADRLPADATEFGARLDHTTHAQLPCQRCHTLDTATRQLRPSRDHASCSGAGCHQQDGGAPPRLGDCTACHAQDLVTSRDQQRRRAPWSVRQRFDHTRHQMGQDGKPAACASCHVAMTGALAALPSPPKRTCEPCHDGKTAFSVTGVGCNRCHGGVR